MGARATNARWFRGPELSAAQEAQVVAENPDPAKRIIARQILLCLVKRDGERYGRSATPIKRLQWNMERVWYG